LYLSFFDGLAYAPTVDLFSPLLLLSVVVAVAHDGVYGVLDSVGGWRTIAGFVTVWVLCQRAAVVAARRKETLRFEASAWVIAELSELNRNKKHGSGGVFASYAKLFATLANTEDDAKLGELTRKKDKLVTLRPFDQKAFSKVTKALGDDMTFNSNAIEGNKITARETWQGY